MAGVYLFMGGTETISNTTYSSGFTLLNSNSVDHLAPISSLCSFIVLLCITLSLSLFVFIVVLFIGTITPSQSGPESNSNEGVLHIPQNSKSGASRSDFVVVEYQDTR